MRHLAAADQRDGLRNARNDEHPAKEEGQKPLRSRPRSRYSAIGLAMTASCAATTSSAIASKVCFQQAAKPTATAETARLAVSQERAGSKREASAVELAERTLRLERARSRPDPSETFGNRFSSRKAAARMSFFSLTVWDVAAFPLRADERAVVAVEVARHRAAASCGDYPDHTGRGRRITGDP